MNGKQRPRAVPVVAAFLFAATSIALVVGFSLVVPNPVMDRLFDLNRPAEAVFRQHRTVAGVGLLLLGTVTFASAAGLLRGRRWAWWLAASVFSANTAGDVVSLAMTGDWARSGSGVLIGCAFLYSLSRAPVRRFFQNR